MLRLRPLFFALSLTLLAARLHAAERTLEFVHALQEAGYGDTAVEYLQMLEQKKQVPPELKAVWDLELSQSYLAGARNAFNEKEAKDFNEKAAHALAKFLKENPTHPEAAKAVLSSAMQAEQNGLALLRAAKVNKNKEQAAQNLTDAKVAFETAKPLFKQALDRFKAKLAALPEPKTKKEKEAYEQAVADSLDGRLQVALLDVFIARTIPNLKDANRVAMLQAASKEFDLIFQHNREDVFGLAAHMWQGKAEEELGNIDKALDIFEEVLSYGPDAATAGPMTLVEPVFAEVEYAHLLLLQKKKKDAEFLIEAKEWLEAFKKNRKNVALNYYQGIMFEYMKAAQFASEKATGAQKLALQNDAQAMFKEILRTPSDFKAEAIPFGREHLKGANSGSEPKTMDEAIVMADDSFGANQWEEAAKFCETALALAPKNANAAAITKIKGLLGKARFNIALELYKKGQFAEAFAITEKIALDPASGDVALSAAAMSVQAALALYANSNEKDRDAAFERLSKIAEYTVATWPGKPEADDARMGLGKALRVNGKLDEALKAFTGINIKSEKYADGMYLAGHTHWVRYLGEKNKAEPDRNKDQLAADRAAAVECLTKSLEAAKKTHEADKPFTKQMLDAQLLLGEVALEGNQAEQSVQMLQPLVDAYLAHKPEQFDATVLRVFTSAVKAYSAKNDLTKAGEVGLTMVELGPDTPQINGVLMEFVKLLDLERKKAEAEVIESNSPAAQKKLGDTRKMLGDIMGKLKDRTQISPASQVFIADAYAAMNDNNNATQQYEKLKAKIEKSKDAADQLATAEAEFKKIDNPTAEQAEDYQKKVDELKRDAETGQALAKAKTRIQSQLIGLKRKQGDFLGALADARVLVKDNPKALEPKIEECRILQAQAEKTQDPKDFGDAVSGWSKLRQMLEGTKPRPPEYYEVLYNAANCLVLEADKIKAKDKDGAAAKALQAEKVLNAALFANRNLSGPDMVAQYNALAKKAAILQGRNPNEKKP